MRYIITNSLRTNDESNQVPLLKCIKTFIEPLFPTVFIISIHDVGICLLLHIEVIKMHL